MKICKVTTIFLPIAMNKTCTKINRLIFMNCSSPLIHRPNSGMASTASCSYMCTTSCVINVDTKPIFLATVKENRNWNEIYMIKITIIYRILSSIFSKKTSERQPIARPWERDIGCFLWVLRLPEFYSCCSCAVRNIALWSPAIYRESIAYTNRNWVDTMPINVLQPNGARRPPQY